MELGCGRTRAHLLVRPGASPVRRGRHDHRTGSAILELLVADVCVPEEWAARGVVGPDLLLVAERRRRLLRGDHGRHPGVRVTRRGGRDVVRSGHGDPLGPLQGRVDGAGGGQAHVVEAGTVAPGERPVRAGLGPESEGRISIRGQSALEVQGQGFDRSDVGRARVGLRPHRSGTVPGGPSRVGRLDPGVSGIEREVDAGPPDAWRERTGRVVVDVAGLLVDVVVGPGDHDVGMHQVDRQGRLVLLVLRERAGGAPDRDQCGTVADGSRGHGLDGQERGQAEHTHERDDPFPHAAPPFPPGFPQRRPDPTPEAEKTRIPRSPYPAPYALAKWRGVAGTIP